MNITGYYYYLEPFAQNPFYVSAFTLGFVSLLQFANLTQGKSEICSLALQMNLEKVQMITEYGKVIECDIKGMEMTQYHNKAGLLAFKTD